MSEIYEYDEDEINSCVKVNPPIDNLENNFWLFVAILGIIVLVYSLYNKKKNQLTDIIIYSSYYWKWILVTIITVILLYIASNQDNKIS